MFRGDIDLKDDRGDTLASIVWFTDTGPYYAHAVDLREPDVIRRIGPIMTLEAAKQRCLDVIEGRLDVRNRAGYPRERKGTCSN
jgi:hypothetical protein